MEDSAPELNKADKPESVIEKAAPLAMGMLFSDGMWVLQLFVLLIGPVLLASFAGILDQSVHSSSDARVELTVQLAEMLVLFFISRRWIIRFTKQNAPAPGFRGVLFLLTLTGTVLWACYYIPEYFLVSSPEFEIVKAFGPALIIPGATLLYMYYFYFFPIITGSTEPGHIHRGALQFLESDKLLPIKAMAAPYAIKLLVLNVLTVFAPTYHFESMYVLKVLSEEVFFLLSSYLALAVCFVALPAKEWRALDMDPYREDRFATVGLQAPKFFSKLLTVKTAIKVLFVAVLVGMVNLFVLASTPPTAMITVTDIRGSGNSLTLSLKVRDPKQQFRSFSPIFLTLAGPEGEPLTEPRQPLTIHINNGEFQTMAEALRSADEVIELDFAVTFSTTRTAEDMKVLEDLHLWYLSAKLQLLDMSKTRIIDTEQATENDAEADSKSEDQLTENETVEPLAGANS